MATGIAYPSLSYGFCIGRNTVSKVVREVYQVILDVYKIEYMDCPSTPAEWQRAADGIPVRISPHCCGAFDDKQIAIKNLRGFVINFIVFLPLNQLNFLFRVCKNDSRFLCFAAFLRSGGLMKL